MAEARDNGSQSGLLASVIGGAVLGAAGLAWWLLSEAERRRLALRQRRSVRLSRLQEGSRDGELGGQRPLMDSELQHKVKELNRAIEDVRRQLEGLSPES
ncbi:hypothetical protein KQ302_08775 [Synechococcus sp. CS-602]|uniref:hypothetical protein n=1 Tax=Synechococcaceae TaxID=1890426 RepID=UPI0008FF0DD6|nr:MULTISPECIES: hypothetical protein [Synechococcaceae]MCT4363376.1 hypothetical protein [Candidatus Regnicoccus frigidus MAG-AL1]APD48675.1 hypothetical protein BM449_11070 [Synechococcus sp. SynAce01]MCT0202194.1 hypothetical protein [Synechococcus sp. CS-603]MCT0205186.1 hypothetical protein [Synechococcus sp. CS-602]MCT0245713.1 hypothetical protein [Synechococcus sp. CS-601]